MRVDRIIDLIESLVEAQNENCSDWIPSDLHYYAIMAIADTLKIDNLYHYDCDYYDGYIINSSFYTLEYNVRHATDLDSRLLSIVSNVTAYNKLVDISKVGFGDIELSEFIEDRLHVIRKSFERFNCEFIKDEHFITYHIDDSMYIDMITTNDCTYTFNKETLDFEHNPEKTSTYVTKSDIE